MPSEFQARARKAMGIDPETGKVEKVPPYQPDPNAYDLLPALQWMWDRAKSTVGLTTLPATASTAAADPFWWFDDTAAGGQTAAPLAPAGLSATPLVAPKAPTESPGVTSAAPSPGQPLSIPSAPAPAPVPSSVPALAPVPTQVVPPSVATPAWAAPIVDEPSGPTAAADQYSPQIQKLLDKLISSTDEKKMSTFWDRLPNVLAAAGAAALVNSQKSWPEALGYAAAAGINQNNELRKEDMVDENRGDATTSKLLTTLVGMQNNQIQQQSLDAYRKALMGDKAVSRETSRRELDIRQKANESDAEYKDRMAKVAEDRERREAATGGGASTTPQSKQLYQWAITPVEQGGLGKTVAEAYEIAFGAKANRYKEDSTLATKLLENNEVRTFEEGMQKAAQYREQYGAGAKPAGNGLDEASILKQYPGARRVKYKDGRERWVVFGPDGKPLGEVPGQ